MTARAEFVERWKQHVAMCRGIELPSKTLARWVVVHRPAVRIREVRGVTNTATICECPLVALTRILLRHPPHGTNVTAIAGAFAGRSSDRLGQVREDIRGQRAPATSSATHAVTAPCVDHTAC